MKNNKVIIIPVVIIILVIIYYLCLSKYKPKLIPPTTSSFIETTYNTLTKELKDEIYQALLVYKVVFFRDQDLTIEEHLNFAKNFGDLEIHPFTINDEQYPEVLKITHNEHNKGRENTWHSDVTWRLEPSLGSILRMKEAPKIGGDTLFSDMYAAYNDLSDEVKEKLDGAVAVHDFVNFRKGLQKKGVSEEEIEAYNKKYPMPEHPVIRTHPDTDKKLIYVNAAFTLYIKDWDADESARMLRFLLKNLEQS